MENGHGWKLAEKFSGLAISSADPNPIRPSSNNDDHNNHNHNDSSSLFQVLKAVEAAEATIKQQVEENLRLRTELEHKMIELHRFKLNDESMSPQISRSLDLQESHDLAQHDRVTTNTAAAAQIQSSQPLPPDSAGGGGGGGGGFSRLSSPSTRSFSPGRFSTEGESDHGLNFSGQGGLVSMTTMAELNNNPNPNPNPNPNSLWKKDLVVKVHEHEQEIMQLRRQLADYSVKESQIRNEKYVLEKRIAHMRLAFDQQQQDLVDAASKALSYRQEIIEENIRLAYALQDVQQERSTFVSSLLPLLAEYSLQPPVVDAQSIASNVQVLFRHLQEKLIMTETKLKEWQYQIRPWSSDSNSNRPNNNNGDKNGLELVPEAAYSHGNVPVSASEAQAIQATRDWDPLSRHQSGSGGADPRNVESNDLSLGRYSPATSRSYAAQDVAVTQGDTHMTHYSEERATKQVTFHDPVKNTHREIDDQDAERNHSERETSSNWSAGNSPYTSPLNELTPPYSNFLSPVLEEPSSSFSEAADDDTLPGIEGLQISGEAYPGRELQACGYSINGTTSCNFEWVRHLPDGSVNYIEGAKQPNYLVTADDVDTYLAIEVQPLDNRKRKGELVKVFANEHKKITCDLEMQSQIEKILQKGHASFKIFQFTGYLDIWEPATLAIKRRAYSIKTTAGTSGSGVVATEKFSPNMLVTIPYGSPTDFLIIGGGVGGGGEHLLKTDNISCFRDIVVLTLRFFILRAGERRNSRKGKKRVLFF